tara:strand:+ start:285 stop:524 length:240 start_codon:yes stop_codon:yes gene_type:complete
MRRACQEALRKAQACRPDDEECLRKCNLTHDGGGGGVTCRAAGNDRSFLLINQPSADTSIEIVVHGLPQFGAPTRLVEQ